MEIRDSAHRMRMEGSAWFETTLWNIVLSARDGASTEAADALERLCRTYWYPLYAYARQQGFDAQQAEDLTQGFFARLLEKNSLARVDQSKGKFRSFLLGSMQHYLANYRDREAAIKRGGDTPRISWDAQSAEERLQLEPAGNGDPALSFDQRWAATVLALAAQRLRAEAHAEGRGPTHDLLINGLNGVLLSHAEAARHLGQSEAGVKTAAHRLRQRFHQIIREEIAHTVATRSEVDDEIRYLLQLVSNP